MTAFQTLGRIQRGKKFPQNPLIVNRVRCHCHRKLDFLDPFPRIVTLHARLKRCEWTCSRQRLKRNGHYGTAATTAQRPLGDRGNALPRNGRGLILSAKP